MSSLYSDLLCPPDYDAEPEMSDGISVISEGEGHNTPPGQESDTTAATTPDADSAANNVTATTGQKGGGRFSFDSVRMTTSRSGGYRPLTPPQTPPTEEEEDEEDDEENGGANKEDGQGNSNKKKKTRLARIQDVVAEQKKEKLDLESYQTEEGSRRFIGLYPRHVVFLMVVCGIIGGMIGHLWNLKYGCNCGAANGQNHQQLVDMYNQVVAEKWTLQQALLKYEGQTKEPQSQQQQQGKKKQQQQNQAQKPPPSRWSGHEEADEYVTVENEPSEPAAEPTPRPYIPSDQFESMIWEHLRETAEPTEAQKAAAQQEKDENFIREHLDDPELLKETFKNNGHAKYKRSAENSDEDADSHERKKGKDSWKKEYKQGSGEKYQKHPKSASSKEAKYQKHQGKYEKKGAGGSGDGANKYRRDSDEDEEGGSKERSSRNYDKRYNANNNGHQKKYSKERSSGEWNEKRNRGRDELRRSGDEKKKNWYLERGNEREINRVETGTAA